MPTISTGRAGDDPEMQHQAHCDHPRADCVCTRQHLISEGIRLRRLLYDALNRSSGLEQDRDEWQVLAEKRNGEVTQLRKEMGNLILEKDHLTGLVEQWHEEASHVLGHVFDCKNNCVDCRRLAGRALQRRP